ncbi:hypothetical protein CspeluHIS016_0505290 [Cutaneotrichosporon spelunceum]|uniref:Mitochondrial inner membrane protease subunit n=1 Tax=Cutaneotrichosporon spelunceum TaxID=1672016 RepID=A0AAD3TY23_9TREE|nr:hypothetical protein CspeluHIS016_0505290 [Cutaneotrichosporon spelunceum]
MAFRKAGFLSQYRFVAVVTVKIFAAFHVLNEAIASSQPCAGWSMYPTLDHYGDAVLLLPMAYWRPKILGMSNKRPERGDLVVTTGMNNPAYTVCKRVVGIEGDVVEIEPTRSLHSSKSWAQGRFLRVPKGHIWIVGDNLSNSTDSRDYGPVPIAMVKGKVTHRIWHRGWLDWTPLGSNMSYLGPSPVPPPGSVQARPL